MKNLDMGKIALAAKWIEENREHILSITTTKYTDHTPVIIQLTADAHRWAFKKAWYRRRDCEHYAYDRVWSDGNVEYVALTNNCDEEV